MSDSLLVFYDSYRADRMGIRLADFIVNGLAPRRARARLRPVRRRPRLVDRGGEGAEGPDGAAVLTVLRRSRRLPAAAGGEDLRRAGAGCTALETCLLPYVIKTAIPAPRAAGFAFAAQKTMYGGKRIAVGDTVFLFASENAGGRGLAARGVVAAAAALPRRPGVERQTPLVSVEIRTTGLAVRPLGRRELKPFAAWDDGRPETELNFKLYRQATDKIVGITDAAASFLEGFF